MFYAGQLTTDQTVTTAHFALRCSFTHEGMPGQRRGRGTVWARDVAPRRRFTHDTQGRPAARDQPPRWLRPEDANWNPVSLARAPAAPRSTRGRAGRWRR